MKIKKFLTGASLSARNLFLIFLALAALIFFSALIELNQSKSELLLLMRQQAATTLETVITASSNAIFTNENIENILRERLINNANFVKSLYENNLLSNKELERICFDNNIYRINIYSPDNKILFSSHKHLASEDSDNISFLEPIYYSELDTVYLGFRRSVGKGEIHYSVALAAEDRNAIVVYIEADQIIDFRREIGFGNFIKNLVNNSEIVYLALQDTNGIIAASKNINELESINKSDFLNTVLSDSTMDARIFEINNTEVYETVQPFIYNGNVVGLFRLGLSLEPINNLNDKILRRVLVITGVLIVLGFFMMSSILIRQNMDTLQKQYQVVETYSSSLLKHVSDAIIVLDEKMGVKVFNEAAEKLFGLKAVDSIGKSFSEILNSQICVNLEKEIFSLEEVECFIKEETRYLLISKNIFKDSEEVKNTILVIRDLTERKILEDQLNRKERLTAMGELASGVAHEIRNPLNSISTIIQQLRMDFKPGNNLTEYNQLTNVVYSEVKRIDKTIKNFLMFARKEPINPMVFRITELFEQLIQQYKPLSDELNIKIESEYDWSGNVNWDFNQMKQVFVNLMQNSIDSIERNGVIKIKIAKKNQSDDEIIRINFSDNGKGISPNILQKIFNLYFTTKAKGTGIGLSIVQRIIDEHGGTIVVDSELDQGTLFTFIIPKNKNYGNNT